MLSLGLACGTAGGALGSGQDPAPAPPDRCARLVALAADADRDGIVSRDEWERFRAGLANEDGSVDVSGLQARILHALLDAERDGQVARGEVGAAFAAFDRNRDGRLARDELTPEPVASGPGATTEPDAARAAQRILLLAADGDGDRAVDALEWKRFLDLQVGESVTIELLAACIRHAQRTVTPSLLAADASCPSGFLASLERRLDATRDGRISTLDLGQLHATLDVDRDGELSRAELPGCAASPRPERDAAAATPLMESPPQMPWQRSLDDALALARATGRPLLLCVNVDGEPASDALATGRYRDPRFAALAEGFVCLLASPARRSRRDHDDRGRRVPDPRFGRIVNQEAIDLEPLLFERYFRGSRVAPRHIGIEPDGKLLFDIAMTTTFEPIDVALQQYGRPPAARDAVPRDAAALLDSPDAGDRERLEAAFAGATAAERERLARMALDPARATQHPELVRLALRDPDARVRHAALDAIPAHPSACPAELFAIALQLVARQPAMLARITAAGAAAAAARPADDRMQQLARLGEALRHPRRAGRARPELLRRAELGGATPDGIAEVLAQAEAQLARPDCTPTDAALVLDAVQALDARALHGELAERALQRWPDAERVHAHLREAWLRDAGARPLLERYRRLPGLRPGAAAWFRGLAATAAAAHASACRDPETALSAHATATEQFTEAARLDVAYADGVAEQLCHAHAGIARLHADHGRLAEAKDAILASLALPGTSQPDGLGHAPLATAQWLSAELARAGCNTAAAEIDAAMRAAPVWVLAPPQRGGRHATKPASPAPLRR